MKKVISIIIGIGIGAALSHYLSTRPLFEVGECFIAPWTMVAKVVGIEKQRYIYIQKAYGEHDAWMITPHSAPVEVMNKEAIRVKCENGEYFER